MCCFSFVHRVCACVCVCFLSHFIFPERVFYPEQSNIFSPPFVVFISRLCIYVYAVIFSVHDHMSDALKAVLRSRKKSNCETGVSINKKNERNSLVPSEHSLF